MPSKSWNTRRKVNKNFTRTEKNPAVVIPNQPQKEITKKQVTKPQTKKTPVKKWSFFSWSKTFGPALFKGTSFLWKQKTLTYSEQAAIRKSAVLFGDKTVLYKVPFNSIQIS